MEKLEKLLNSAKALEKVPQGAINSYLTNKSKMLDSVNQVILKHPNLPDFLGDNTFDLLSVNHRNHVSFMAEIFTQNDFESLAKAIPWVYRAYHNQGVSYDYFKAELTAWINAISSYIESEHQSSLISIYQWMLNNHQLSIELSGLENDVGTTAKHHLDPIYKEFSGALTLNDHQQCLSICHQALKLDIKLPDIFNYIIYPSMVDVGIQWEAGEISVAQEHQATAIVNRIIARLYYDTHFPDSLSGRAVVSAAPSEKHEMGAWMLSACLELDGWEVKYLGSDLPVQEIISTTLDGHTDLLALSIAMPFNLDSARRVIKTVKSDDKGKNIKIIVGGQVFNRFPHIADNMDVDKVLSNCWEAVEWAKSINREVIHDH